jgi:hypothetical protein
VPSLGEGLRTRSIGSSRQEHDWQIDLALVLDKRLAVGQSRFDAAAASVRVVAASLFAEPLNVGFGLLARWISLLTNLGDALVLARRLYVYDETLLVGCADDPPLGEGQTWKGEHEGTCQREPA